MAITIEIAIPPNTTVILPASDTLSKAVSDTVTINVDNESGETISLSQGGTSTDFTVDTLPATIVSEDADDIVLGVLDAGSISFDFDVDSEQVDIELTASVVDIDNAGSNVGDEQLLGRVTVAINGHTFASRNNGSISAVPVVDITALYQDRFDDPTYYDGDV